MARIACKVYARQLVVGLQAPGDSQLAYRRALGSCSALRKLLERG